ncbi:mitochondrial D-lactate dehydrogenase (cytochrome) [Andalucia godoyi]|uniref:D-lactate dehydrogenase (cytochrome) n=1 Tax=Andalucia godoyi TaxID=505711 RepID=A0A8K0F0E3_ANDGO|nr:mitochondrial D-lactate dehydrogenase (cytochrome) [Andalucia godoyi]|eukprot:ANDGO_07346.mRNA.1 mitochondrial D-lactate dehydrogenase (cytochrome)
MASKIARPTANTLNKLHSRLVGILGESKVSTARAVLEQHGKDLTYHPVMAPDIVCFPGTTDEVSKVVKACAEDRVPIVPFGAGTSLEGHITAPFGGVSLDLSRNMTQIKNVRVEDLDCTVQAGVTRNQLNAHLKDTGLFFSVDPGADATLGGMVSTRASGTTAVRYGTMRDVTVNLEVVLPSGEVIQTTKRSRKTSAGYNLTSLMVGAEGTLGVVTEATLRLQGVPAAVCAASCAFPNLESAVMCSQLIIQAGIPIARCEFLDEECVKAVNKDSHLGQREVPTLFLEFHGASESALKEQVDMVQQMALDFGGEEFHMTFAPEDRTRLWKARHHAWHACTALKPDALAWSSDVCVPISKLAECVSETKKDIENAKLLAPIVGHVGDGNFHCFFIISKNDPSELDRAKIVNERMVRRAISLDGTITGEHGIGIGKQKYLIEELGPVAVDVMRAVKNAIDPLGIMNPGKIFST